MKIFIYLILSTVFQNRKLEQVSNGFLLYPQTEMIVLNVLFAVVLFHGVEGRSYITKFLRK